MTSNIQLPRSTPEAEGIPSAAILAFLRAIETEGHELHSVMLLRRGSVVAEGWWSPYTASAPHMLYSLSKSFASTAAGLASAEGYFSLNDPVLSFFPDDAPVEISPNLAAMQVRHLLSMSTGHDTDSTNSLRQDPDQNWVRAFLAQPVEHAPGTHFVYNSGATYMVSAIVQKATGQTVLDFLMPRLFAPLGIENPTWENSPQGINVGGWGLSVRTEDIAKFGQLYLQDGVWEGKRLLPEGWVAEATAKHVSNGDDPNSDWAQGYGYQFWRCRHGAYRGDGAFGQYCIVLPAQGSVIAITSGVKSMGGVLDAVWKHLLPAFGPEPLAPDSQQTALTEALAALALPVASGSATSPIAAQVSGKTYAFAPNSQGIEAVTWEFGGAMPAYTVRMGESERRVLCGSGAWERGDAFFGDQPRPVAASGAWMADDTFVAKLCFYETPYTMTVTCRFAGNQLSHQVSSNVSFGPTEQAPLEGRV